MIPSINVTIWGKPVGSLVETGSGRNCQICFYFDPMFVRSGLDIAPLRASINGIVAQKGMPIYPEKDRLYGGLPSFIADSMPDKWGHLVFSQWAKAHNINMKNITALDRLAYIGRRGMGALEFMPPTSAEMETSFKVEIDQLSCADHADASQGFQGSVKPRLDCGKPFQSRNFGRRSEAQSFNQRQSRIGGMLFRTGCN